MDVKTLNLSGKTNNTQLTYMESNDVKTLNLSGKTNTKQK